jgi:hypothetical protein
LLATEQLWSSAAQDSVVVADCMCAAADKCAQEDRPKEAAALLVMAARRGVAKEHQDKVAVLLAGDRRFHHLSAARRLALEAACSLMGTPGLASHWNPTLMELGVLAGDRHTVGRLAKLYGRHTSELWYIQPLSAHADWPLKGYNSQPYFHQINTKAPGTQLISDNPYIFLIQDFFSA